MDSDFPIVALACSLGGLDALLRVLSPLPLGFAAAMVVVQHHHPRSHGRLADRLDRQVALPVRAATDGAALRPGVVLVAPPGRHILATTQDSLVTVASGAEPAYRPCADLLLTSLAVTAGPRVIAVILSGLGHDGATGATAVHRMGGQVIVSDPRSATAPSMPQATIDRPEIADLVVTEGAIADVLTRLTRPPDGQHAMPAQRQ